MSQHLSFMITLLPGLVIGLTVHEAAHAISAKWLGDDTAYHMGRVSLNPFRHLSFIGTAALFLVGFGWGKPVIVNIYNFKRPRLYYLLSSLAGPASNIVLSAIALGVLYLRPGGIIEFIAMSVFFINAVLAMVNLLPIPPLDGSKIWPCLIPGMKPTISAKWNGIFMIVLVVALYTGLISAILTPVMGFLYTLLPG